MRVLRIAGRVGLAAVLVAAAGLILVGAFAVGIAGALVVAFGGFA